MIFKILWIEDQPQAISSQRGEIEDFLKEKFFAPEIETIDNMDDIEGRLNEKISEEIDIIVTDNNLDENFNGSDVLEIIRNKSLLTDVLFYSNLPFEDSEVKGYFGTIGFAKDRSEIVSSLEKLIEKNIKRCNDIVFLRGFVLSKVVDLEIELNQLFAIYFKITDDSKDHFQDFLMENRNFSLYGKQAALSKIIKNNKDTFEHYNFKKHIQEIATDRNYLAHSKVSSSNSNCLVSMGEEKEFDRTKIKEIIKQINDTISAVTIAIQKLESS